jgi:hypothetical protein
MAMRMTVEPDHDHLKRRVRAIRAEFQRIVASMPGSGVRSLLTTVSNLLAVAELEIEMRGRFVEAERAARDWDGSVARCRKASKEIQELVDWTWKKVARDCSDPKTPARLVRADAGKRLTELGHELEMMLSMPIFETAEIAMVEDIGRDIAVEVARIEATF